jgi:hypothetical protein
MADSRIEIIDRRLEQLKARRSQLLARENAALRRLRTRQAIILGTWLLSERPDVVDLIKTRLVRPQDRQAFDLVAVDIDPGADLRQDRIGEK